MRGFIRLLARLSLVLLPLGLGLVVLVRAASERELPSPREPVEVLETVRVITVEPTPFVPQISVFGSVAPASTWRGLAQVPGEVIWMHADLRPGRLIEAGAEIIRIDSTDYELAEAQAIARLAGTEARMTELGTREANLRATLAIERRALELGETNLERQRALLQRQAASQATVDQTEEAVLQRRARVQEITNALRLLPAQRRVQEAERAAAQVHLAEARRNIARTRVQMPFDGRIEEVSVEREQFVTRGEVIAIAEDIAEAEIAARLHVDQMQMLVRDQLKLASMIDLSAAEIDAVAQDLGLTVELRLKLGGRTVTWPAGIRRLSFALDSQTRTIGLVVGTEDPFRLAIPGSRPPLVKDMFVEILLSAPPRSDALAVPREALERHDDGRWAVYVVDADDRLRRRLIEIDGMFGNAALVAGGLGPGDRVVVGELAMPVEGMRLAVREDKALKRRLIRRGAGRTQ